MDYLHAFIKLVDATSVQRVDDLVINYDRFIGIDRILALADGAVTIDLSALTHMLCLHIETDQTINLVQSGNTIVIQNNFVLLNASIGLTFTLQNPGTTPANIMIRGYGVLA
jgi:hypothetical protein